MIRDAFPHVGGISCTELATLMEEDPPLLLDVRTAQEYAVSHLRGARRYEPALMEDLDRDAPIVVYGSIGYRSAALASRMQAMGFLDVRNLEGSIFQWANADRPVYSGGIRVSQVHPMDGLWGRLLDPFYHWSGLATGPGPGSPLWGR